MAGRFIYIFIIIFFLNNYLFSQEFTYLNTDNIYKYEQIVYTDTPAFHTSIKPYLLNEIININLIDSIYCKHTNSKLLNYLFNKNIAEINYKNFRLSLNPVINLVFEEDRNDNFYNGSYGLALNTNIKNKFALACDFAYNKCSYPYDIDDKISYTGIIPRFGKYEKHIGNIYDFYTYSGYLSYNCNSYINLQAGIGKNFLGDGYRSLLLSDNSNVYPFFKTTVNFWKIKYLVLFSALKDINSDYHTFKLYEKYSATHYLSWNVFKFFNFNLFETVIWRGGDSTGYRGFDVNYLNPVVIYRPVEYNLGSPDNVILGLGFKFKFLKSYNLYGQLLLDEFKLSEIKKRNGWWANKYGYQVGIKCFNFLTIKNLLFQSEYNYIRPYTYSHINTLENYGSYYQPLAHPLGANLEEVICLLRYSYKRISINIKGIYSIYGADTMNSDFGQNIYLSYTKRNKEYENIICQGVKTELINSEFKIAYLINYKLNLQLEIGYRKRMFSNKIDKLNTDFVFIGIRTGLYNTEIE